MVDFSIVRPTIEQINKHIGYNIVLDSVLNNFDFGQWYCGITNDAQRRKIEHENKKDITAFRFKAWNVKTLNNSSHIEDQYSEKGMRNSKGARGAIDESIFVYVFLWVDDDSLVEGKNYLFELLGLQ